MAGSIVLNGSSSGTATINTSSTGVLALPSGTTVTNLSATTPTLGVASLTTVNGLTPTALSTGFSLAGGTTSKTLTVDATVSTSALAPLASPTFTGLPPGTAPTAPNNGDCWTTTLGLYCRINGATVGPYGTAGGGDSITTPNGTLSVAGTSSATTLDLVGAAGEIMAGATPALTYTPTLGKSGTAGTLSLFPASGNFTTTLGSAATASNTVNFFASVPTNLHSFYCATASTTCTLTDAGYAYNAIPVADVSGAAPAANPTFTGTITTPLTTAGW